MSPDLPDPSRDALDAPASEPFAWRPEVNRGVVLQHVTGGHVVIERRKQDDSGWWLCDGGGLADDALYSGTWRFVAASVASLADHRESLAVAYIEATNPGIDRDEVRMTWRDRSTPLLAAPTPKELE